MSKAMPKHWLMKTEPDGFSIDDLERVTIEPWTGVRNFQARNFMRAMAIGDEVLFYHSSADPTGVAGLARVHRVDVVDDTQFDPRSPYHDPTANRAEPRWTCVDVTFVEKFAEVIPLAILRAQPALEEMVLLRKGSRLSVQPVTPAEYKAIVKLARPRPKKPPATASAASRRTPRR